MNEKVLQGKKNGMLILIGTLLMYVIAVLGLLFGISISYNILGLIIMVICIAYLALGWIVLCGLKVLKPQEALVLTLFGKYIGTLKNEGFYFVNPFCSAINPAARTKLNQSGDVKTKGINPNEVEMPSKKLSLKIMTLNNAKQKINDCLGNPIEIGIAVTWRITDTAKAVFNVDNYKEFLSLQCDSALRNIVRIYPYDVAPNVDTTGDGHADEGSLRGSSEIVAQRIKEERSQRTLHTHLKLLRLCCSASRQAQLSTQER